MQRAFAFGSSTERGVVGGTGVDSSEAQWTHKLRLVGFPTKKLSQQLKVLKQRFFCYFFGNRGAGSWIVTLKL